MVYMTNKIALFFFLVVFFWRLLVLAHTKLLVHAVCNGVKLDERCALVDLTCIKKEYIILCNQTQGSKNPLTNFTISVKLLHWKVLGEASSTHHLYTTPWHLSSHLQRGHFNNGPGEGEGEVVSDPSHASPWAKTKLCLKTMQLTIQVDHFNL